MHNPSNTTSDASPCQSLAEQPNPTPRGQRMPDVIMIGAAKSASTYFTRWIAQHPAIGLCDMREPNFFSHAERFAHGFDWYSDLFRHVRSDQLALDSSTGYALWPHFPEAVKRIARYAPHAKLIYLMRHPVERAYSHYIHRWTRECHPGEPFRSSFDEYVQQDKMCIDGSDYRMQIQKYLQHFDEDSLLCLFTFQVQEAPIAALQQVCRFLGIDDDPTPFQERPSEANRTDEYIESQVRVQVTDRVKRVPGVRQLVPYVPISVRESLYGLLRRSRLGRTEAATMSPPPLSSKSRQRWIEYFANSNAWVEQFTGQDLSIWNR